MTHPEGFTALASTCTKAADKLGELVGSGEEKTALQAAKAVLEMTLKAREQLELADRLEALERRLAQEKK